MINLGLIQTNICIVFVSLHVDHLPRLQIDFPAVRFWESKFNFSCIMHMEGTSTEAWTATPKGFDESTYSVSAEYIL